MGGVDSRDCGDLGTKFATADIWYGDPKFTCGTEVQFMRDSSGSCTGSSGKDEFFHFARNRCACKIDLTRISSKKPEIRTNVPPDHVSAPRVNNHLRTVKNRCGNSPRPLGTEVHFQSERGCTASFLSNCDKILRLSTHSIWCGRWQTTQNSETAIDTTQVIMGNQSSAEGPGKNRGSLRTRSKIAPGDSEEARLDKIDCSDAELDGARVIAVMQSAQSLLSEVLALGSQCSCVPKSARAHPTSCHSANRRRGFPIVVAGSRPSLRSPGRRLNGGESLQIHSMGQSSSSALIADSEACNLDPLSALPVAAGSKSSSKASSQDTVKAHYMHPFLSGTLADKDDITFFTRQKVCRSDGTAHNHASTTSMESKKKNDRRRSNMNYSEKHEYDEDGFPRVCSETAVRELSKAFKRLEKDRKARERKQAKKDAQALQEQRDFHLLQISNRSK